LEKFQKVIYFKRAFIIKRGKINGPW